MKKHKFSEKLPEVGKEIFAKIRHYHGAFRVRSNNLFGEWYLEATDYFINGFNYTPETFIKKEILKYGDWWADPEEEG